MTYQDFFYKALFVSLFLHTLFVCGNYLVKLPEINKAKTKKVEISYRPPSPKTLDIKQHAVKPAQKLDLQNSSMNSKDTIAVKMSRNEQSLKGLSMYERKPAQIRSQQASQVAVKPIKSEKVNSPIYTSYQDRIRESIKERVYANYSRLDRGNVYLTFIIASDGSLKAYQIIDEKTNATANLRFVSTKSLKEARFPPFLKGMTLPEYTFNIEIEYQVSE